MTRSGFRSDRGLPRLAGWTVAVLALAACGEAPPPDRTYSLPLTERAGPLAQPKVDGTLMIDTFRTDAVLVGRRIAWRESPDDLVIRTYPNHLWNAQPPRLLQAHLHNCLGAANVAQNVVMPTDRARIDVILGGDILAFEQHRTGADSAEVAVTVDVRLSSRQTRDLIWQDRVSVTAPAASAAPEAAAAALATALDALCGALVERLPQMPATPTAPAG